MPSPTTEIQLLILQSLAAALTAGAGPGHGFYDTKEKKKIPISIKNGRENVNCQNLIASSGIWPAFQINVSSFVKHAVGYLMAKSGQSLSRIKKELCSVVVPWWLSDVYYLFSTHSTLGLRTDWILWNLIGASEVKSVVWKRSMKLVKSADGPALVLSPVEGRRKVKEKIYQKVCRREKMEIRDPPLRLSFPWGAMDVFQRLISGLGSMPWNCALAGSGTP